MQAEQTEDLTRAPRVGSFVAMLILTPETHDAEGNPKFAAWPAKVLGVAEPENPRSKIDLQAYPFHFDGRPSPYINRGVITSERPLAGCWARRSDPIVSRVLLETACQD